MAYYRTVCVVYVFIVEACVSSAYNLRTSRASYLPVPSSWHHGRVLRNTRDSASHGPVQQFSLSMQSTAAGEQLISDAVLHPATAIPLRANPRTSLYFRPVSVTLYCVMILTIQSLLVYTGLAVLRNVDELAARSKPSMATATFAAASRSSVFPSMLCMLFVGCRMYVLATTQGLGEPPMWVKFCMVLATLGMTLQFVIVFTLPFLTKAEQAEDTPEPFDLVGSTHDVHPNLHPLQHHNPATGWLLKTSQTITVVLVYGGALGVLLGVATFPKQRTAISPAVKCTCAMSLMYFFVYFILWAVRTYIENKVDRAEEVLAELDAVKRAKEAEAVSEIKNATARAVGSESEPEEPEDVDKTAQDTREVAWHTETLERQQSHTTLRLTQQSADFQQRFEEQHKQLATMTKQRKEFEKNFRAAMLTKGDKALKGMAMNMSMSARKAPMMAVLFLAARMRALQLNPPDGMPPAWAQFYLYLMTGALFIEIAVAGYIGYTGSETRGYYGAYAYHAKPAAHLAQHASSLLIYFCLIPIITSIFLMGYPGDSMPAPLSPTVKCVMWFELFYFSVTIGQWLTIFVEDILQWQSDLIKKARETLLAASVSLTCAPLLCVLFVACRMRSLQITQQRGNPPGWAQDCMFMCVCAIAVQLVCCLMMPIFTTDAAEVDEDGNATYDVSPMMGAYFVTVVKYIALMMLHGGVLTVCVAVMVMTPDMCMRDHIGLDTAKIVKGLALMCLITLVALLLSSAKVVGLAIKFALESCDDLVLGTQITVKKSSLSVLEGYVNVQGFVVENPPVKEDDVEIDSPWSSDCLLRAKTLVIKINVWRLIKSLGKEFELQGITIKGLHVNYEKWSLSRESNVNMILEYMKTQGYIPEETDEAAPAAAPELVEKSPSDSQEIDVIVQQVDISDIMANGIVGGMPMSVSVADIQYDNFTEETNAGSAAVIVSILLCSVLKSILANFTNVGGALSSAVGAVGGMIYNFFTGSSPKNEESEPLSPVPPSSSRAVKTI